MMREFKPMRGEKKDIPKTGVNRELAYCFDTKELLQFRDGEWVFILKCDTCPIFKIDC